MAFNDHPIVDENAKRCEESVLFVRQLFSMNNKFISREQFPDYGIDLLVELASNTGGATGKDFAIQIKSTFEPKIVKKNDLEYYSLTFKTSRLGHLCRRPPAHGIIIYYDQKNRTAYFDFVEDIVHRATSERDNELWKSQDDVDIHFPTSNILTHDAVEQIYQKVFKRFKNYELMASMHGSFFNIPFLSTNFDSKSIINFKNPVEFLNKYGSYLINNNEYRYVYNLLSTIPFGTVIQSKDLLFFAAIVYSQCGYYIDAKSFIEIALSKYKDWDEQHSALLDLTKSRLLFALGQASFEQYNNDINQISDRLSDDLNIVIIQSQKLHIKLLQFLKQYGSMKDKISPIIQEIMNFLRYIDSKEIPFKVILFLKLDCAHCLAEAAHFQYAHDITLLRMREKLNISISDKERLNIGIYIADLIKSAIDIIDNVLIEADKYNYDSIKAHALFIACNTFYQLEFNSYVLNVKDNDDQTIKKHIYKTNMERINLAAHLFHKNHLLEDTHNMLCLASDTNRLYKLIYGGDLTNYNEPDFTKLLTQIEKVTGLTRPYSLLDTVKPFGSNSEIVNVDSYSKLTDEDIDKFAPTLIETLKIPSNRLDNIKYDLIQNRYFCKHKYCNHLFLLQNLEHTKSPETLYSLKPPLLIECLIKRWQSQETIDICALLNKLKSSVCGNCSQLSPNVLS